MKLTIPFNTGIKYENVFTRNKFHPKTGLIPYIELNGEQFSDSNLIIEMLQKKFEVEMDTELSAGEEAMTRAATGMVESFTAQTGFYYRYGLHMEVGDKEYLFFSLFMSMFSGFCEDTEDWRVLWE